MANDEIVSIVADEDFEGYIDASNVCAQSTIIRPQRCLPPGKKYHIFISYSSSDQAYVLRLKTVLDGLGFKCMVAEEDFCAGVPIMTSTVRAIQTSHKLLLVVSKHFLRSQHCDREVDMAQKYAADNDRDDFLIVVRLDETRMPLKLDYMTYVNGVDMKIEDVGRKVEEAYAGLAVLSSQNQNGVLVLRKFPTEMSQGCCISSCQFQSISQKDRQKLKSSSIEESSTCYREMLKCANDQILFRILTLFGYGTPRRHCLSCISLHLCVLTLFSSAYLFFTRSVSLAVSLPVLFGCICALTVLIYFCWYFGSWSLSSKIVHKLCTVVRKNTDFKSQNYLVLPRRYAFYKFVVYNTEFTINSNITSDLKPNPLSLVKNFLEKRARECWPNASEEDIDKKCRDELFKTILDSFVGSVSYDDIPNAKSIRHATYRKKCCLCQLARSSWTEVPSRLSVHQGQGTDSVPTAENESTAIGHKTYSPTENDETGARNVFGIDNCNYESTEENDDETCVMKIACNEHGSNSSNSHGASLTGAIGGRLLESNTDQWYQEYHVRGEATHIQNTQVSLEMINLEKNTVNFSDSEMSTSFNVLGEDVTLPSEDEERQRFRGEHFIDEETHL